MGDLTFTVGAGSSLPANLATPRHPRLSLETLGRVAAGARRPAFDPAALRIGMAHIGCGAFHRAHQAVFTQRAIEAEGGSRPAPWGIAAISMKSNRVRRALLPQDGLYTVLKRGPQGTSAEVVGSLRSVVFAPDAGGALPFLLSLPVIRLVTLTVTSAGYCLDAETGRLATDEPAILSEIKGGPPRTAVGLLVKALEKVKAAGRRPPVILACDNIPQNGQALRHAVVDYAGLKCDKLASWIEREVQFPSSVVDRIVPAPNASDWFDAADLIGLRDQATVATEPFRQWVIEDFVGPRPLWEAAGAEFVTDVTAWESSKIRMLNGTHLAISYLGTMAGLQTVADVMSDADLARYIKHLMFAEIISTIPPAGHDLAAYGRQLLARWQNPAVGHELARVGRNSSDKMHPRLLQPLLENLAAGRPVDAAVLAVAAWVCCMCWPQCDRHPLEDPLALQLRGMGQAAAGCADALATSVLTINSIFGSLSRSDDFRCRLAGGIALLQRVGARDAARRICDANHVQ